MPVPLCSGLVEEPREASVASVGEKHVDRPELVADPGYPVLDRLTVGLVDREREDGSSVAGLRGAQLDGLAQ
jgi:hypothetical protein